jgi:Fe-S oxidoreductase
LGSAGAKGNLPPRPANAIRAARPLDRETQRQEDEVVPYDVHTDRFWSQEDLNAELLRVSQVCCDCRLCFKYCPSFPALFEAVDNRHDGEVSALTNPELRRVVDLCFQCKLCYLNCPYTPDQNHPFDVDFPRLMLREKMVRARSEGVTRQDRFLGNPDFTGALGGLFTPLSNWAMRFGPNRMLMEKVLGLDRRRALPPFQRQTFDRWFRKREKRLRKRVGGAGGKVVLFTTCSVNYNYPEIGKSAIAVLAHNDVEVVCPEQRCCGMPYLDGGDLEGAKQNMKFNLRVLRRYVDKGYTVVVPQPTCGYVLKRDYPWLDEGDDARVVGGATKDLMEFLSDLHAQKKLDTNFKHSPGKVLYHLPCHLKAQNIGYRSRDVLKLIPGTEIDTVERCSGMDGTWGMKREYFDASLKVASPVIRQVQEDAPDRVSSDCALAGLQITQGTGKRVSHPIELLREAYGLSFEV